MANYIFNIDGAGCVNQRIGKYPMETCGGKITDISISGAWDGTSINIDESDTTYGYIVLSVPSNESATDGRSQDVTISFKNDGTETSVTATLCQTNNGSEPPAPTGVKATMIMIDSSSASVACDVVMMRKEAVMRAGNYQHLPLFEDYDLWVRMLRQGARFHNLQESLLSFRLTSQLFSRRGGRHYIRQEIKFQRHMRAMGHIGYWQMGLNVVVRTLLRVMPKSCRRYGYLFFLRR